MSTTSTVRGIRFPNDLLESLEAKLGKGKLNAYVIDLVRAAHEGSVVGRVSQSVSQVTDRVTPQSLVSQLKGITTAGERTKVGHKLGCTCLRCNPPHD